MILPGSPEVPEKDGYSGVWEDFSQENITFDQTIEAVYTEYITTLEANLDGTKLPKLLAEGTFDTDDSLEIKKVELYPEDAETRAESYQVRLETSDIGKHLYRFLPDASLEMENPSIEIYRDKAFVQIDTEQDGATWYLNVKMMRLPLPAWTVRQNRTGCVDCDTCRYMPGGNLCVNYRNSWP